MFKAKLHSLITLPSPLFTSVTTRLRRAIDSLITFWRHHNHTIFLILLVVTATVLLTAAITTWLSRYHNLRFPSLGTIHTIGIKAYEDPTLQHEINQTQWGTIYPGTSNNVTLYLQSSSNIQVTLINETANWAFLDTANNVIWGPSNTTTYMTLTWTYNGTLLNPNQTIPVTLTLHAHNSADFIRLLIDNNVTQFHFDIIIRANPE